MISGRLVLLLVIRWRLGCALASCEIGNYCIDFVREVSLLATTATQTGMRFISCAQSAGFLGAVFDRRNERDTASSFVLARSYTSCVDPTGGYSPSS